MAMIQNIIQPIIRDVIESINTTDLAAFDPTDLSGLLLWLDAQDFGTFIEGVK